MSVRSALLLFVAAVLLSAAPLVAALYSANSAVVQTTAADFKNDVLKQDGVVLVEFYAPWCGHCKNLAPEWEKAAAALKGVASVVAVDCTQHEAVARKYGIQGFPTIKVFGADKKTPTDYQGERNADGIINAALRETKNLVNSRVKGKSDRKSNSSNEKKKSGEKKNSKSDVVELNESNFNALVLESNQPWFVEFYAPWCGHCKNLAPQWEIAARKLAPEGLRLGAVDATVSQSLASQYQVKGYPTILIFEGNGKPPRPYNDQREADAIVAAGLTLLETTGAPVVINQLVSQDTFDSACRGSGASRLCAVLFAPHILDSQAAGRNNYLATLQSAASVVRRMPIGFLWSEAGAQPDLEAALGVSDYPTIVLLAAGKNAATIPKISWSEKNVANFLSAAVAGREKPISIKSWPSVVKSTPWDGKDSAVVEEEFSLADIMGDEL